MQSYIVYYINKDEYKSLYDLLSNAYKYICYSDSFEGTIYEYVLEEQGIDCYILSQLGSKCKVYYFDEDNEYYLQIPIEINI